MSPTNKNKATSPGGSPGVSDGARSPPFNLRAEKASGSPRGPPNTQTSDQKALKNSTPDLLKRKQPESPPKSPSSNKPVAKKDPSPRGTAKNPDYSPTEPDQKYIDINEIKEALTGFARVIEFHSYGQDLAQK